MTTQRKVRLAYPPGGFGCLWMGFLLTLLTIAGFGALAYDRSNHLATQGEHIFMGMMLVFTLGSFVAQGIHTVDLDTGRARSRQGVFFPRSTTWTELGLPLHLKFTEVQVRGRDEQVTEYDVHLAGRKDSIHIARCRSRDELAKTLPVLAAKLGLSAPVV